MSLNSGFVDLRLNHQDSDNEDSFWPSFTDIMTVIVMIFLLAMVILLLRNVELVTQLRATIEAERAAAELARATGKQKESLYVKLISTENELSMLRMQLMRREEQREQQEIAIDSQQRQIAKLTREKDSLTSRVLGLTRESNDLREELDGSRKDRSQLVQDLERLQKRHLATRNALNSLRTDYGSQEQELDRFRSRAQAADHKLARIQGDYTDLKQKYDRLIRPARTPKGKYVVEVRYAKRDGAKRIAYRRPGDSGFTSVTRSRLDSILSSLKQKHPGKLYIKVIIPKNSGLSYSDAWSFTSHMHSKYDYYSQEKESDGANPDLPVH